MEKDLVCGMNLDQSKGTYDYKGKTYHFCSEDCRNKFSSSPESYIK
jgi:Cu+-exporting ATPase